MRIRLPVLAVLMTGYISNSLPAQNALDLRGLERSFKQAVAAAENSVACIYVSRRDQDPEKPDDVPEYFGNGVVIDHRLVLTCYHVVRDAQSIVVRLGPLNAGEPRRSRASIYAADNRSDLAVLQLENQRIESPPIAMGRGEDLTKGNIVLGLSHPFVGAFRDSGPSATWGIISNLRKPLNRDVQDSERHRSILNYRMLLETDARLSFGSSGAALLNLDGQLVGLMTQPTVSGAQLNSMAIPIDAGIRRVIEVLRKGEEVEYGFLGVHTSASRVRRQEAVVIRGITANSPAQRAGLEEGDVVLQINGQPIRESDDMFLHVGLGLAGRELIIQVMRPGERQPRTMKATLAKLHNPEFGVARNRPTPVHGLWVDYATVSMNYGQQILPDGVIVREVEKGSPADLAKLGDYTGTITELNGVPIRTPTDFYHEAEKATRAHQPIRLQLADNPPRTVILK